MKNFKFYIAALLITAMVFLRCGNTGGVPHDLTLGHKDTVTTIAVFLGYQNKTIHTAEAKRITYDTIGWVGTDSTTQKKKLTRMVWYEVSIPALVDSAINSIYKVPFLDSLGKPNMVNINNVRMQYPYLRDTITDLNATKKFLEQFVVKDAKPPPLAGVGVK